MNNDIARSAEQQAGSRLHQSRFSSEAQPSRVSDQSAEGGIGNTKRTLTNHLNQLEVAREGNNAYWAMSSVSAGEQGPHGTAVLQSRTTPRRLSPQSERMIASKIEQLELSQLRSPQLKELVKRLKRIYSIEQTPRDETASSNLRNGPNPYAAMQLGERWQELAGCSQWDGLMDPMDPVLRAEIVRYGEFSQAAYDSFESDSTSKYYGSCKYTKDQLLGRCGLENRGYKITQYLYATAELELPNFFSKSSLDDIWSKDSNWVGFVAVCTSEEEIARLGRRDIVVAWRGTSTKFEWIKDIQDWLAPAGFDPRHSHKDVMVENGFLSMYKSSNQESRYNKQSAREQVLGAVRDLVEEYKHDKRTPLSITVTGHSLGSALATLCGYDIAEAGLNRLDGESPSVPNAWYGTRKAGWDSASATGARPEPYIGPGSEPAGVGSLAKAPGKLFPSDRIPVTVISFAGPRVGNRAFKRRVEELGVAVLRVANKQDLVTKVPGKVFPKLMEVAQLVFPKLPAYKHVGVKLRIDSTITPFLQDPDNVLTAHNLEGYLHVVDGFHGPGLPFKPTMRDYALLNKGGDYLKREYFIPAAWWQEANKGLVQGSDGRWVLPPRGDDNWPATPALAEQSPEVKKDEQSRAFWRSVSVAYKRSTSRPSDYVSFADVEDAADVDGAAVNGAGDGASNGAANAAGDRC